MPDTERAAQLLNDMLVLWQHPGVTNKQRESLVQEVFNKISLDGDTLVAVEPNPEYAPLFADILTSPIVGYREFDSALTPRLLAQTYLTSCACNYNIQTNTYLL
ncbi:hypothetical protein ACFLUU_06355 [Chloroflexota bacterium]